MSIPTGATMLASNYLNFQGLSQLKLAAKEHAPAAVSKVAHQFEAVFIEMMLKSMREATPHAGLLGSSEERLYQNLYDHQIALNLAQGQGIGLSAMIEKAIRENAPHKSDARTEMAPKTVSTTGVKTPLPAHSNATWPPQTPADFVQAVLPYAKAAAQKIGVSPAVLIAQAALESGWGKHLPRFPDGASSHNLFGIKAGAGWQGQSVNRSTVEFQGGVTVREKTAFRAYRNIAASFHDYAQLISQHPRYHKALEKAGNPQAYLAALQQAGYATDPRYADKITTILQQNDWLAMNHGLKNSSSASIT